MQRQTVRSSHCLSVVEIHIASPDQRGQTQCYSVFIQRSVGSHLAVFQYNAFKRAISISVTVCGSLLQQADEVMIESDCFVQTRLTHHNSVSVGKKVSSPDG